jgi:hypothetical protein
MAKQKPQKKSLAPRGQALASGMAPAYADFDEVLRLIDAARARAFAAVKQELVGLYWQIGEYIFAFVGERYRLQVGGRDFFVDLLFWLSARKRDPPVSP